MSSVTFFTRLDSCTPLFTGFSFFVFFIVVILKFIHFKKAGTAILDTRNMEIVIYKYGNMAYGACFKHIANIYASPARKVAVLPQMAIFICIKLT
jgi:hypothetical protein